MYPRTPLSAAEMTHIRGVLQFILDRHLPYGAVVADRYWNIVMANGAAELTLPQFSDASLWTTPPPNLLRLVLHPLGLRRFIVNWDDVASAVLARAHRELVEPGGDRVATALLEEIEAYPGLPRRPTVPTGLRATDLLLPVHLRKDGLDIRIFSAIMTFGTPQDVTLQELRVETFVPADADSDRLLQAMAGPPSPTA